MTAQSAPSARPAPTGAYVPSTGDLLHVWPGLRAQGIEPRLAVALTGPVPFGGTMCVRVEYLSGRRVGGTDYLALTHVLQAPDLGCPFHERGLPLSLPPEVRCTCDCDEFRCTAKRPAGSRS